MKILFFCGCLEPGRDGVGDYTRQLSARLIENGHQVTMVALNDRYVNDIVNEYQPATQQNIKTMRCAQLLSWKDRITAVKNWVQDNNPDWLSLQYVPYSFNNRGLPFYLATTLNKAAPGKRWHIMFHELWIGFTRISPFKHRIIGFFQKRIVSSIVTTLKPRAVTTSNRLYQQLLKERNIHATVLPLFSNIPIAASDVNFTRMILGRLGIDPAKLGEWQIIGIFGTVYPGADLGSIINTQIGLAKKLNKKTAVIHFGKNGSGGAEELQRLGNIFQKKIQFVMVGEQSEENISRLLQIIHVAISCTPPQHIGKSGVFAALRYHGVEVLLPKGEIIPEYKTAIESYQLELKDRNPEEWGVEIVSKKFIEILNQQ